MRVRVAAVLCASLSLLGAKPSAAAVWQGDQFKTGNWSGGAYDGGDARQFSHCAISASYRNGILLLFSLDKSWHWRMAFQNNAWNLQVGQRYDLAYSIDGRPARKAVASALQRDMAVVELPDDYDLFVQFRRGYMLRVEAEGLTFKFALDGTSAAFQQLASCVSRNTRQAFGAAPAPTRQGSARSSSSQVTAEQRLEATKVIANILAQGQMSEFHILTASELNDARIPDEVRNADVSWIGPGVIGVLNVIPRGVMSDLDAIASAMIGSDAKACKGAFASGSVPDGNAGAIRRVYVACRRNEGEEFYIYYTIVARTDGSFYNIGHISRGGSEPARKAEENIRQAVYQVMGR